MTKNSNFLLNVEIILINKLCKPVDCMNNNHLFDHNLTKDLM